MNATRTLLVLLTLTATALAGCSTTDYESLTVHDWKAELEATPDAFLLDVRTVEEFQQAHIEGATLVPVDELLDRTSELPSDKDAPIFVYCRSGNRSGTASGYLVDLGYTHVVNLAGGINDWIGAGYPVVQG